MPSRSGKAFQGTTRVIEATGCAARGPSVLAQVPKHSYGGSWCGMPLPTPEDMYLTTGCHCKYIPTQLHVPRICFHVHVRPKMLGHLVQLAANTTSFQPMLSSTRGAGGLQQVLRPGFEAVLPIPRPCREFSPTWEYPQNPRTSTPHAHPRNRISSL